MKYFTLLTSRALTLGMFFSLLLPTYLASQSAPKVEGDLLQSGVLEYQNVLSGHYRLTDNSDDDNFAYTLTLLGTDLQPLGSKVYKAATEMEFEAIAFNGRYLGLLVKEKLARYLEILDGNGEQVRREYLKKGYGSRGFFLHPVADGFIASVGVVGNVYSQVSRISFTLNKVAAEEEEKDWEREFKGEKKNQSVIPRYLAGDEENLVLVVTRLRQFTDAQRFQDLYNVDPRTGENKYRFLQADKLPGKDIPNILQAELVAGQLIMVRHKPESRDLGVGLTWSRYDAAGKLQVEKDIASEESLRAMAEKAEIETLDEQTTVVPSLIELNPAGILTVGFETYDNRDASGKRISGRRYKDGYVLAFDEQFIPIAVTKVEKSYFTLSRSDVQGLSLYEKGSIKRKLRKGKAEKLSLKQLLSLHGGPYGFVLTDPGADYISHYFLDRTFSEEGVVYHGISVVTFIDGEFIQEHIPLEDDPGFVALGRAKEGYLKLTEYKMGEGIVDIRLERLSY